MGGAEVGATVGGGVGLLPLPFCKLRRFSAKATLPKARRIAAVKEANFMVVVDASKTRILTSRGRCVDKCL